MRIVFLTSNRRGIAGSVLQHLCERSEKSEFAVVLGEGAQPRKNLRWANTKLRKIRDIGVLGAANGIRLRTWFDHIAPTDLETQAENMGVELFRVPHVNSSEAVSRITALSPDLMISLGNPIMSRAVFDLPKFGTINYHGELLPEYPGAQSIIWPIYFGRRTTGFTIHKVTHRLDGGDILVRREFPIRFRSNLRDTVVATGSAIREIIPFSFLELLESWGDHWSAARSNSAGRHFTTPSFSQFLTMRKNNRRLFDEGVNGASHEGTRSA